MTDATLVPLLGSERHEQEGATRIGPVSDEEPIDFSVVVRAREGAPAIEDIARTAATTGNFLSREQLAEVAAPDPADVQAVEDYATSKGLTVDGVDPITRRVKLSGPATAVKQAFGVSLDWYEHEGVTFRGRTGSVLVPQSLADVIVGVLGTDNRPMARRHTVVTGEFVSGHSVPMNAAQMASFYNFPPGLDGSGECIGIIEFGGGYFIQDINTYFSQLGMSTPSIVDVSVSGGSNSPVKGSGLKPFDNTPEVELDIEVMGSAAPGAKLVVYFVGASTNEWVDALSAAIHDSTNDPSVLSISWETVEDRASPISRRGRSSACVGCCGGPHGVDLFRRSGFPGTDGFAWVARPRELPVLVAERDQLRWHRPGARRQRRSLSRDRLEQRCDDGSIGRGCERLLPGSVVPIRCGNQPTIGEPTEQSWSGGPRRERQRRQLRGFHPGQEGLSGRYERIDTAVGCADRPGQPGDRRPSRAAPDNAVRTAADGWGPERRHDRRQRSLQCGFRMGRLHRARFPKGTAILLGYRAARRVAPTVTRLSASTGNPGDRLVINGTGLLGATAVRFGAVVVGFGEASPMTALSTATPRSPSRFPQVRPPGPQSTSL